MMTNWIKRMYLILLILFITLYSKASELDSLLTILPQAKDTQSAMLNIGIGKLYLKQRNFDKALQHFNASEAISKKLNYKAGEASALHNIGKLYSRKSSYDTSEVFYKRALSKLNEINRPENKMELMNDYAILYYYKGEYNTAIKICYNALKFNSKDVEPKLISRIYNNLGNCYYFLKDLKNALKYYNKAYDIETKILNKNSMANCLGNIGLVYFQLGDYEASLKNHMLSYNLQSEIKDTTEMAASLINMSMVYEQLNQFDKVLTYTKESLKLRRLIHDERRLPISLISVALIDVKLQNYSEAKALYEEAIELSTKNNSKQYLMEAYEGLSDLYEKQGDFKFGLKYHKLFSSIKDSIYSATSAEEIAQAQEKYESEKKQRALDLLKKDQVINQIKLEKNKSYLYITVFIILIIIILLALLFKQFKLKQKSNTMLENQNNLITEQKKEITDSINYASMIQRAILPLSAEFNNIFPNNFIFYIPKDIVSGDFYWCGQKGNKKIVVAADCTGHGVPGAMMSMVGINILNQAINDLKLITPSEILHFLDNGISKTLHQNENLQTIKNSMDLSICIIDELQNNMVYGGSMNPLYLIKNNQLQILKTDKVPIGYSHGNTKKVFNNYSCNFDKGDRLYLFTDGIPDQFGGENGKKLLSKNLQNILMQLQNQNMMQQHLKMTEFIQSWKGNFDQTDDMLLIGIEL